jgi:hypothetical protein
MSDLDSCAASDYGITFTLSAEGRSLFLAVGNDLANVNGADSSQLHGSARRARDPCGSRRGHGSMRSTSVSIVSSSRGSFRRAAGPNM